MLSLPNIFFFFLSRVICIGDRETRTHKSSSLFLSFCLPLPLRLFFILPPLTSLCLFLHFSLPFLLSYFSLFLPLVLISSSFFFPLTFPYWLYGGREYPKAYSYTCISLPSSLFIFIKNTGIRTLVNNYGNTILVDQSSNAYIHIIMTHIMVIAAMKERTRFIPYKPKAVLYSSSHNIILLV